MVLKPAFERVLIGAADDFLSIMCMIVMSLCKAIMGRIESGGSDE
jgi:hypothetical protein